MYDQPDLDELLNAVIQHLEQNVVPLVKPNRKLYFQTLISVNILKVIGREITQGAEHRIAEWERLNNLQDKDEALPASRERAEQALLRRNQELCEEIRAGRFDEHQRRQELFLHLIRSTQEQLHVANPKFLAGLE